MIIGQDGLTAYLLTKALPVVKVQKRTLTYWIQTKKKGIFFPYYGKITYLCRRL